MREAAVAALSGRGGTTGCQGYPCSGWGAWAAMSGHIVLIGLSGSGKSTVARLLAQALGRPVYDTDAMLSARSGMPVPDLLRATPERFRALEEDVVAAACAAP